MELAALAPAQRRARRDRTRIARDDDLVLETIREHARSLLATAGRHSMCADDAHDAYQRALEIFLRRAGDLDRDEAHNWLHAVVRHEALEVRERRLCDLAAPEPRFDAGSTAEGADESADRFERLAEAACVLAELSPDQARALLLLAQGYSYSEIAELTGWSNTKVNRCITEGRRAFGRRLADVRTGQECRRWAPTLATIAEGKIDAEALSAIRPHLRACASCRATLQAHRGAPAAVGALFPVGVLAGVEPLGSGAGVLGRVWELVASNLHDRAALTAAKLQLALDGASAYKVAAVAASATAVAGGGAVAVERAVSVPERPAPAVVAREAASRSSEPPAELPAREIATPPAPAMLRLDLRRKPSARPARPASLTAARRATKRRRTVAPRAAARQTAGEFGFEPAVPATAGVDRAARAARPASNSAPRPSSSTAAPTRRTTSVSRRAAPIRRRATTAPAANRPSAEFAP